MNNEIIADKSVAGNRAEGDRKDPRRKEESRAASAMAPAVTSGDGCARTGELVGRSPSSAKAKAAKIRYRKRGVERTKLQVYVSNEVFDRIYALARRLRVSMGAAVEKLAEGDGTKL